MAMGMFLVFSRQLDKLFVTACLALLTLLVVFSAGTTSANGYLFFHEHIAGSDGSGTVYYGSARDVEGRPVPGVQVLITAKSANISLSVVTDTQGRYRSSGLALTIDPVATTCEAHKDGYSVIKAVRLSSDPKAGRPVETNFVLLRR